MAYTEYDYNGLAHLPEDVNCIVESSHSAKRDKEVSYLGGASTSTINSTVDVELFTKTDEQAQDLYVWYVDTIVNGTLPFTAIHEIFGRNEHYVLQIIDGISEKIIGGNNRKIKFSAEVIGVSFPVYDISSPMEVLSDGTISANVVPQDPKGNITFDPSNFTIDLNGVNYSIESAEKNNDILLITPTFLITDYPTVSLTHSVSESGLRAFTKVLDNNSAIGRASIIGTPYTDVDGETITVTLSKAVPSYIWEDGDITAFTVAEGENTISAVSRIITSGDKIIIIFPYSRPIFEYEIITVTYNETENLDIAPFSNQSVINNSNIASSETNTVLDGAINESGDLTIANMSVPQDKVFDANNFTLKLNGIEYPIVSARQSIASLRIENSFIVTDYASTVVLKHYKEEWGFVAGGFTLSNNSTVNRIVPVSATISEQGVTLSLVLDRETYDQKIWIGDFLSYFSLKVDGAATPILHDTFETYIVDGTRVYELSIDTDDIIFDGQTVLLSFGKTDDIELAPFIDFSVTNQSTIPVSNRLVGAIVSIGGLTITGSMTQSISETTFLSNNFVIGHGYLDITPTSVSQDGTILTITLPKAITDDTVVTVEHTGNESVLLGTGNYYPPQSEVTATNNSTVSGYTITSMNVVTTGTYILVAANSPMEAHEFGVDEFVVKVNGTTREIITPPYSLSGTQNIWIYTQGIIITTDTVTLQFVTTTDPQIDAFSESAVTNNSTEDGSSEQEPPIYLKNSPAIETGGFYWLENTSASGAMFNGKLCNAISETWTLAELNSRYNYENRTVDLSDGYYIDTGWIPSSSSSWNIKDAYNIVYGGYDMYTISYNGDSTADIYRGDQDNPFPSTPQGDDVSYTPPTTSWKIYKEPPSIIFSSQIIYDMSTFNPGEYIDDSGLHGFDALLAGTKGVDYDYNTTDQTIQFHATTGSADTDIVLPESGWILYEVHNVEDTTTLSGATTTRGIIDYTTDTSDVAADIETWRSALVTAATYTLFELKATYYKGSDVADVYTGDESTSMSIDITDGTYELPSSEWIIGDALLADDVSEEVVRIETNGDFDTSADWTNGSNITYNSGAWEFATVTNEALYQASVTVEALTEYNIKLTTDSYIAGYFTARFSDQSESITYVNSGGEHNWTATTTSVTSTTIYIQGMYDEGATVDMLSIEVTKN